MRKAFVVLAVTMLLAIGSLPAGATSNSITLGSAHGGATFTGTGSSNSINLDFGTCVSSTCTLSGVAFGTGMFQSSGTYSITSPSNIDLELTDPTTGLWTANTQGNSIAFNYGTGGSLLTGTLNLLQFQEISPNKTNGNNWYLTSASVTITGGSLDITPGMTLQLFFNKVPLYFNNLLGPGNAGKSEVADYGHGGLSGTPEPATLLLLGSGFLLVGLAVRVRLRRGEAS